MKFVYFIVGIVIGVTVAFVKISTLFDLRLADNAAKMLDMCELQLPRDVVCLLVAMPESMLQGGVPFDPDAPVGGSTQGGFPLLFPPQIQEDDTSVR